MRIIYFYIQLFIVLIASSICSASIEPNRSEGEAVNYLRYIHSRFSLLHGSFNDEYPEQVMSAMFISPDDKVLEIGGNIGRNSCVIASLLNDPKNLVVTESDPGAASILIANRNRNGLFFHVEDSAISQVPLMQGRGITSFQAIVLPSGYFQVKTILYTELKEKYKISFNVLVADCEGALYHLFQDDESILDDVSMLILENDYTDKACYEDVRTKFITHGFHLVYNKSGGWPPCFNEFYQVWKKF